MKSIREWLDALEPLAPLPTTCDERLERLDGVKAVIFDIYGTLLISASGDIDEAVLSTENLKIALEGADYRLTQTGAELDRALNELLALFADTVRAQHRRHAGAGHEHPEVDIRQVWSEVIGAALAMKAIAVTNGAAPDQATFIFELLSNRVYPMPGMASVIAHFRSAGVPLGIVSNAQFYTPVIMNHFLSGTSENREDIDHFDPELTVYSYQQRRAKPDPALFRTVADALQRKHGIAPEHCVFVGNDMLKDIHPAQRCGMRTVLFAGDARSLRLRSERPELAATRPDAVIKELGTLKNIITI